MPKGGVTDDELKILRALDTSRGRSIMELLTTGGIGGDQGTLATGLQALADRGDVREAPGGGQFGPWDKAYVLTPEGAAVVSANA
jgi:hypothetical protein